ncbi:MAG TPA: LPS export ABC transporter periplasmic protein LptC [Gemmatimonadales bacterium]|jgi:LPS export ABC transporter protein LptC
MIRALTLALLVTGCVKHGVTPHGRVAADSADQVYDSMTFDITRNGVVVSHVVAESAWVYQGRQVADLKRMTVTFHDSTGAPTSTITAKSGVYSIRLQNLDARGNVIATSPGGKVLKTEHLVYDRSRNRINADTAFTSTSPQGNMAGAWIEFDPGFTHVTVNRPTGRQKGKGILIPGPSGSTR